MTLHKLVSLGLSGIIYQISTYVPVFTIRDLHQANVIGDYWRACQHCYDIQIHIFVRLTVHCNIKLISSHVLLDGFFNVTYKRFALSAILVGWLVFNVNIRSISAISWLSQGCSQPFLQCKQPYLGEGVFFLLDAKWCVLRCFHG